MACMSCISCTFRHLIFFYFDCMFYYNQVDLIVCSVMNISQF